MDVIGIIAEYNPFHNGHLYQINEIKKKYPNSIIIAIIDGYFTQRGYPSIITKEDKVKDALSNQVDLVIELPVLFATQSADIFASKALELLNELKINKLCFGSESNNLEELTKIAKLQLDNNFDNLVKEYLKEGINYPTALTKALNIDFNFNNPNDLLAISYIKTILKNNYNIKPISIKRTNEYHDLDSNDNIISASNIRQKIINQKDIKRFVPIINDYHYNDYYNVLKISILNTNLNNILDVDEGLENKILDCIKTSNNLDDLILNIKSKRYTYNKINRMLTHILLGINKEDALKNIDYLRILGFNMKGKEYLNQIKKDIKIPLYSNKVNSIVKDYELKSSMIYDIINNTNTFEYEIKNKPLN